MEGEASYRGDLMTHRLSFNSHLHTSLSFDSLVAALQPAQSDYLYFVSDNNGHHRFARSAAEHERNVLAYRRAANGH